MDEGAPTFKIISTCKQNRYTIEREVITDPRRETVLQRVRFEATEKDDKSQYKIFLLIAPHINDQGAGNDGWVADYNGVPMLFAYRDGITLAVALKTKELVCANSLS